MTLFFIRFSIVVISSGALIACSAIPDKNIDPAKNNEESFRKDLKECQEDYPTLSSGLHIRQWQGCMSLKGWK